MPDPISLASIAAALGISKTLMAAFKDAGDSDRAAQLVEIMAALSEAREEITRLNAEIKQLETDADVDDRLTLKNDALWLDGDSNKRQGPYCPGCWGTKRKLVYLISFPRGGLIQCPGCDTKSGASLSY